MLSNVPLRISPVRWWSSWAWPAVWRTAWSSAVPGLPGCRRRNQEHPDPAGGAIHKLHWNHKTSNVFLETHARMSLPNRPPSRGMLPKPRPCDAMSSRCRRTHRGSLLCYLLGALGGVTLVLVPDHGGHVPVVLRCCRGKTAVNHSDLCCYLIQRQRGHACIMAATRRCGHRPADRGRFPARFADLDDLTRVPRSAHPAPVAGSLKTSNRFLESVVAFKAARAGGC